MGFLRSLKKKMLNNQRQFKEKDWIVKWENNVLTSISFEGKEISIPVDEINSIEVETNDAGPWGVGFWWKIQADGKMAYIPNGATGEQAIVGQIREWPNFQINEFGKATQSNENENFLIWEKTGSEI